MKGTGIIIPSMAYAFGIWYLIFILFFEILDLWFSWYLISK